jgi:hypothetical protein
VRAVFARKDDMTQYVTWFSVKVSQICRYDVLACHLRAIKASSRTGFSNDTSLQTTHHDRKHKASQSRWGPRRPFARLQYAAGDVLALFPCTEAATSAIWQCMRGVAQLLPFDETHLYHSVFFAIALLCRSAGSLNYPGVDPIPIRLLPKSILIGVGRHTAIVTTPLFVCWRCHPSLRLTQSCPLQLCSDGSQRRGAKFHALVCVPNFQCHHNAHCNPQPIRAHHTKE